MVLDHEAQLDASGRLVERRRRGDLEWMNELISIGLGEMFRSHPAVAELMPRLQRDVRNGNMTPLGASRKLLALFQPELR